MSIHRAIRQTHHSGAWAYAKVLEVNLGYATVELATNGVKLTNLSIAGGKVTPGERVIVDYSAGTPPVVSPITIQPLEEAELPLATIIPEDEPSPEDEEPIIPGGYWTSGDHGVKAYQFGGTYTTVTRNEWQAVRFSHVDWDTEAATEFPFFDPAYPYYITVPAPGFYFCIADVGWGPCGSKGGMLDTDQPYDLPGQLKVSIQSNAYGDIGYNHGFPIARIATANRDMQAFGQAPLEANERIQLLVNQDVEQFVDLVQTVPLRPRLTVHWMGNYA